MKTMYSERIGGAQFGQSTDEYKFEKIKRAKREALQANPDIEIIDLGVGEPDRPADESVVEVLAREAGRSENRYYADNGITEFQYAAAAFLDTVYRVRIDSPEKQLIHGVGSKPILAMLPLAFIDTHDVILQPIPGYPVLATYAGYLGGEVVSVPLTRERGYLPDYSRLPDETLNRTKLLYVNYPNNPTGAIAGHDFFRNLLDLARKHNFLIVHDAAYAALTFDEHKPLSILTLPGAFDHAIEIHSLSKSFNMTGWRIAFVVGRREDSRGGDARIEFRSAEQFSDFLIRNSGISTVPWDDAGSFVRMSVTFEAEDIDAERRIIEEVETRLARCELIFDRRKK
jgi:LL-diaminopimelate aminotransferase